MKKENPRLFVGVYDTHYPHVHQPTLNALLDFLSHNKVAGFIFGGDQLDNNEISHHTRGKPGLREEEGYARNTKGFDLEILRPVERLLPKDATRVWLIGNHDDWENDLANEQPELRGSVERPELLKLADRGWKVVECGDGYREGKLHFIHGDTLSGGQYHAKRAVELYCKSVVYGHFHAPQSFTKVLPHDSKEKWMAYCSPVMGETNPRYLQNRPTAWLNGITLIEFWGNGFFNVYPVITSRGCFAYGGRVYGR